LEIDKDGQLSITKVHTSLIDGFDAALSNKADVSVTTNLATQLNTYMQQVNTRIDNIDTRLTWQALS
jgi:hypothetical protein